MEDLLLQILQSAGGEIPIVVVFLFILDKYEKKLLAKLENLLEESAEMKKNDKVERASISEIEKRLEVIEKYIHNLDCRGRDSGFR